MNRRPESYNGVLLINKPVGLTSHDVVQRLRKTLDQRRIGHTGTLDPLAEGLLVTCLGSATKVVQFLTDWDKTYQADIVIGQRSNTFDREGINPDETPQPPDDLTKQVLEHHLDSFRGKITQQVPAFSSVRVGGRRLYELARDGAEVSPPSREVEIKSLKLLDFASPHLRLSVTCSKGTYLRSLANDLGEAIGCGAYLAGLVRQAVGGLHLDNAITLDEAAQRHDQGRLHQTLLPCHRVLQFAAVRVTDEFSRCVIDGRSLGAEDVAHIEGNFEIGDTIVLKNREGLVLAVGTAEASSRDFGAGRGKSLFEYVRVLN